MNNLTLDVILEGLQSALREKVQPALADDPYAAEQVRLVSVLLGVIAPQLDTVAALRAAENSDMRALFGDAAAIVGGDLGIELAGAAGGREPGLKLSELDREGGRLRALLVELHMALEGMDGPEAVAMHQRIWRLLREMEERRS